MTIDSKDRRDLGDIAPRVSDRERRLYVAVLIALTLPAALLFSFPGLLGHARCCMKIEDGRGFFERLEEVRIAAESVHHASVASLAGHRPMRHFKKLDATFPPGELDSRFQLGLADMRGAVYHVVPGGRSKEWQLPVGGVPGVAPAWSGQSRKIAFYRLQRIWLTDEQGSVFVDVVKLPGDFVPEQIRWRCDGAQLAVGGEKMGWYVFNLNDKPAKGDA